MDSALIASIAVLTAPLLFAALGGLLSERAGVMNIALEGMMLTGACIAAIVGIETGSAFTGLAAGVVSAILVNLLHAVLTQAYRIDHIVSGMAINLLALGGTNYLLRSSTSWSTERPPVLEGWVYWPLSIIAVAVLTVYLVRTRGGLRLLAVGNDPDKARLAGIEPAHVRYLALIGTGVLTGLAGAALISNAGGFVDGMTAGRGYIALAALILGAWRVLPTLLACTFFGVLFALQIQLQGAGIGGYEIPKEFWLALPYIATLAALAGLVGKGKAPAGLGKP